MPGCSFVGPLNSEEIDYHGMEYGTYGFIITIARFFILIFEQIFVNALPYCVISDPESLILPLHLKNLDVSEQVLAILIIFPALHFSMH
jgi:hypothetical protein